MALFIISTRWLFFNKGSSPKGRKLLGNSGRSLEAIFQSILMKIFSSQLKCIDATGYVSDHVIDQIYGYIK